MKTRWMMICGLLLLFLSTTGSAQAPTLDRSCVRECRRTLRQEMWACRVQARSFRQFVRCARTAYGNFRDCVPGCVSSPGEEPPPEDDGPF